MRYFFSNLSVTIKELFQSFLELDLKKKIISALCVILAIAGIITGVVLTKQSKKTNKDPDKTAYSYVESFANHDYLNAYEYSIIGKNGVYKYLEKNYFDGYKHKDTLSEQEEIDARNIANTLNASLNSFMNTYGIKDYDNFFGAYFDSASELVNNFLDDTELTDALMIKSLELGLAANKEQYIASLNEQYNNNYEISISEPTIKEFSDEDTATYIANKSEAAVEIFEKSGLKPEKIKKLRRYDYSIYINDLETNVLSVYLVKIGGNWYVDLTTLVY